MKQISSADLHFLNKEFQILKDQRIDNFYYEDETFYLKVYITGKGNHFLTNKLSKYIYLTKEKEDTSHPNSFISYLRKYLKNSFIREIKQVEGERILKIKIDKKEEENIITYYLILELFANGNIIVCDNNMTIKNAAVKRKFKDRKVMVKDLYELPPQKEITLTNLNEKTFLKELNQTDLSIVKFLAIKLGVGGKFAEEICALAELDKNKQAQEINQEQISELIKTIQEIPQIPIEAYTITTENQIKDFIPFNFKSITENKNHQPTFNKAIKLYYTQFIKESDTKEDIFEKELKKLQNRLSKQEEQLIQVKKDYEKYNQLGNKIYENYAIIEELLNSINNAAKEKGWDHVKQTIKNNPKLQKIIKTLNYKNNEIILNL